MFDLNFVCFFFLRNSMTLSTYNRNYIKIINTVKAAALLPNAIKRNWVISIYCYRLCNRKHSADNVIELNFLVHTIKSNYCNCTLTELLLLAALLCEHVRCVSNQGYIIDERIRRVFFFFYTSIELLR